MTMSRQMQYTQPSDCSSWLGNIVRGITTIVKYVQEDNPDFYKALGKQRDMILGHIHKNQEILEKGDWDGLRKYNKDILDNNIEYARMCLERINDKGELSLFEVNMGLSCQKREYNKIGRKY